MSFNKVSDMAPINSSHSPAASHVTCPQCAAAAQQAVLERARAASALRQIAAAQEISALSDEVLSAAILASPDPHDVTRLKAELSHIRATWWYRVFAGKRRFNL
jgi:hypothetical protein